MPLSGSEQNSLKRGPGTRLMCRGTLLHRSQSRRKRAPQRIKFKAWQHMQRIVLCFMPKDSTGEIRFTVRRILKICILQRILCGRRPSMSTKRRPKVKQRSLLWKEVRAEKYDLRRYEVRPMSRKLFQLRNRAAGLPSAKQSDSRQVARKLVRL